MNDRFGERAPPTVEATDKPPGPQPEDGASDPTAPHRLHVAGHDLTIFAEATPLFEQMVEDIRASRQRVWLETYLFMEDAAGRAVAAALQERARAGLDVRLLYDAIGSYRTSASLFQEMARAGVQVHAFHSLWEALWRFSPVRILNRRDHRKLLVLDARVAYFGGMNVVDRSRAPSAAAADRLPTSAGWRDVHVRLEGPQQAEVAESFARSWQRAHGQPVSRRARAYRQVRLTPGEESIQFFDSGPGLKFTRAARVFSRLLAAAQRRVTLSMAYFLPVGRVRRELLRAHRRGVFIRLIVPGQSDVPVVQAAARHLYTQLLRKRFHIFERQQNMLHSKVMVVDDQWSVVGSCNLDARSLWINYEFLSVIHSRSLARALNEIIRFEIVNSHRITVRDCRRRSHWQRLIDRAAWSFRWWL